MKEFGEGDHVVTHTVAGGLDVVSKRSLPDVPVIKADSVSISMYGPDGKSGHSEESADRCTQTDTIIHEDVRTELGNVAEKW